MPIYEYECGKCGHRFEKIQKFSDPPVEVCPSCGGPVHKMQSAPAFQFKGTGWYVTDYPKGGASDGRESKKTSDAAKPDAEKSNPAPAPASTSEKKSGD